MSQRRSVLSGGLSVSTCAWSDARRCGSAARVSRIGAARVDVEHQVVALGREVGDRREVDRRGVVDDDVDAAPALGGGGHEARRPARRRGRRRRPAAPRRRPPRSPPRPCGSCRAGAGAAVSVLASSAIRAPARAQATAMARPMPRLPPDITTTRPESGEDMRRHATGPRPTCGDRPGRRLGCRPMPTVEGLVFAYALYPLPPGRLPFRRWRWELWHGANLVAAGWRLARAGRRPRAARPRVGVRPPAVRAARARARPEGRARRPAARQRRAARDRRDQLHARPAGARAQRAARRPRAEP